VPLDVERTDTPFTTRCERRQVLTIPVKHGEGNWYVDDDGYAELEARRQIVLRYTEPVNGSRNDVAGVVNEARKRDGADAASGSTPSTPCSARRTETLILSSLVESARERALAAV
jgi:hypothetical protein